MDAPAGAVGGEVTVTVELRHDDGTLVSITTAPATQRLQVLFPTPVVDDAFGSRQMITAIEYTPTIQQEKQS